MKLPFHKFQACGNDFVLIDHRSGVPAGFSLTSERAAKLSHRQYGVGCDQILWVKPGTGKFAAQVAIVNADGSEAEMCGNGMRAIGVYLGAREAGMKAFQLDTASGTVNIDLTGEFPEVSLGTPKVLSQEEVIPLAGGIQGFFTRVDMGNPHAVFFLGHGFPDNNQAFGKLSSVSLDRVGRSIENHVLFPNRTNVEFVECETRDRLRVRVWERGTGATLACGSGACAVVAAAEVIGLTEPGAKVEVQLPGGSVFVRLEAGWQDGKGSALLSGPAEEVFTGEWKF